MATFSKVNGFIEAAMHGKHDLSSDTIMIALTNAANAPDVSDSTLSDITQISYDNLGNREVTVTSSGQTSGVYKFAPADKELTASGAVPTFRWAVLYNDSATAKDLIGFVDLGQDITLANSGDSITLDFDDPNGLFQI